MDANFQYDKFNVPILSSDAIEIEVAKVLNWYDKTAIIQPIRIDIFGIYNRLMDNDLLVFSFKSLNTSETEPSIFGRFVYGTPPTIILDKEHNQQHSNERVRFTMAHELGHYVLHRCRKIDNEESLVEDKNTLSRLTASQKSGKEWAEWQANYFAGAILLPSISLKKKLTEIQKEKRIHNNLGIIYFNKNIQSQHESNSTISELAYFYGVSRKCTEIRLRQLNLIKGEELEWEQKISQGISYEELFPRG